MARRRHDRKRSSRSLLLLPSISSRLLIHVSVYTISTSSCRIAFALVCTIQLGFDPTHHYQVRHPLPFASFHVESGPTATQLPSYRAPATLVYYVKPQAAIVAIACLSSYSLLPCRHLLQPATALSVAACNLVQHPRHCRRNNLRCSATSGVHAGAEGRLAVVSERTRRANN